MQHVGCSHSLVGLVVTDHQPSSCPSQVAPPSTVQKGRRCSQIITPSLVRTGTTFHASRPHHLSTTSRWCAALVAQGSQVRQRAASEPLTREVNEPELQYHAQEWRRHRVWWLVSLSPEPVLILELWLMTSGSYRCLWLRPIGTKHPELGRRSIPP